jgi:hypothetical protein
MGGRPIPKGPRGEKRPGDVVGAAIKVAKIATGEIEEDADEPQSARRRARPEGQQGARGEDDAGTARRSGTEGSGEALGKVASIKRGILAVLLAKYECASI